MNVTTSPYSKSRTFAPEAPKQLKPHTEQWAVDGQAETFSSTTALVSQGEALNGKQATYSYTLEAAGAPFTSGEKFANAIGVGLQGAVGGAVGGAVCGAVLSLIAGVGDLMGGIMGGRMSGVSSAVLTVPIALGTLAGAGIGAVSGYQAEAPEAAGGSLHGTLQARDGKVLFYPNGQVDREVNLTEYQSAGEAELIKPEAVKTNAALDTVKGALVGAAIVPSVFIPLAGIAAGGYVGIEAGAALDKRTELGKGLGLTLGVAATASTIAIGQLSSGRLEAAGALAGGLAVVGAALGHKVFEGRAQGEEHHDYGTQWWNVAAETPQGR